MDDRLKDLMKELGDAINESLSDSDRIAAAIGEIKRAGYDVFLVLEATIGFNKREDNEDDGQDEGETVELEPAPESGRRRLSKIKLTSQRFVEIKCDCKSVIQSLRARVIQPPNVVS